MSRNPDGVRRSHAQRLIGGVVRAACWTARLDADIAKQTLASDEQIASVNCAHCLRWLKGDETPGCCATVQTLEGAAHFSMQRMIIRNHKRCDRKAKVRVGDLDLCGIHHRLVREGMVDESGTVADHGSIRDARNYPERFPGGLHSWHSAHEDKPITKEKKKS